MYSTHIGTGRCPFHAMTDLLAALRASGGLDVVGEALALVLEALIDAEVTGVIGARRYQRSASRTTQRDGIRVRLLSTRAGEWSCASRTCGRAGASRPCWSHVGGLTGPADRGHGGVVHGTSTRKVDDLVRALGVDAGISKSEVSRICAELDHEVAAFGWGSLAAPPPRTCWWTVPASRPRRRSGGQPRRRHRQRGDRRTAAARSWAWMSATPSMMPFGRRPCGR
jgi:hypothetical protein